MRKSRFVQGEDSRFRFELFTSEVLEHSSGDVWWHSVIGKTLGSGPALLKRGSEAGRPSASSGT